MINKPNTENKSKSLSGIFSGCMTAFIGVAVLSAFVNLLYLTSSLFMMEVYDRVLPSRSIPTLIALLALVIVFYAFQGVFDSLRGRLLIRIADRLDQALAPRIYDIIMRIQLIMPISARNNQPMRDLDSIRAFLSSSGPIALFDLPWLPFYIAICFFFHFWLGVTALAGAIILALVTLVTEMVTRRPVEEAARQAIKRSRMIDMSRRNADIATVHGMLPHLKQRWHEESRSYACHQRQASDISSGLGVLSKALRMLLQSGILAVGAWLVIQQQATPGIIIAGSILSARALAPVDLAIANWKGFIGARQSRTRLKNILKLLPDDKAIMDLPAPTRELTIDHVTAIPPEFQNPVLHDISFSLKAGMGLGIIGASGSGKSCLARILAGIWLPARGTIRFDGATLDQWAPATLARHIGYMPQSIELLDGTIAENIAAFDPTATAAEIINAAQNARVHDLIITFEHGYDTEVGELGHPLSAGQKQRIALARALFRDPFITILDEPNSNLDAQGDEALTAAILSIRQRNGIAIVIAHRPSALIAVDQVLMLNGGKLQAFGPKDEVLAKVLTPTPSATLKVVHA